MYFVSYLKSAEPADIGVWLQKFLHKATKKENVQAKLQKITYYEAGKQVTKFFAHLALKA